MTTLEQLREVLRASQKFVNKAESRGAVARFVFAGSITKDLESLRQSLDKIKH